ncbi:MAG TPA: hypothetical protein VJZ69_00810 [Clostridia bacterium]|nr:hypothetical protein [Clostridia bacterium]
MILFDTRNQKDTFISEPLTNFGFATDRTKLPFGDIATADDILNAVDIKSAHNGLQELAGNICSGDHNRLRREIEKCAEYGGKLTFLVVHPHITKIDEVCKWKSEVYKYGAKKGQPYTKVKGDTLMKAMKTMSEPNRYGCEIKFEFATKATAWQKVLKLLGIEATE